MTSKCPPTPPPGPECPQQPGPICTQDGSPSHPGLAGRETKEPTKQHSHVRANDAGRRRDLGKLEEALLPPGGGGREVSRGFQTEQAGGFQTEGWRVTVCGGEGGALGDSSGSVWSGAGSLCREEALKPGPDHTGSRKPC